MADLVAQVQEALSHAGALHAIATSAEEAAGMAAAEAAEAARDADTVYSRAEAQAKATYDKAVGKAAEARSAAKREAGTQAQAKQAGADEARAALVAYQADAHKSLGVKIDLAGAAVSSAQTRV